MRIILAPTWVTAPSIFRFDPREPFHRVTPWADMTRFAFFMYRIHMGCPQCWNECSCMSRTNSCAASTKWPCRTGEVMSHFTECTPSPVFTAQNLSSSFQRRCHSSNSPSQ